MKCDTGVLLKEYMMATLISGRNAESQRFVVNTSVEQVRRVLRDNFAYVKHVVGTH